MVLQYQPAQINRLANLVRLATPYCALRWTLLRATVQVARLLPAVRSVVLPRLTNHVPLIVLRHDAEPLLPITLLRAHAIANAQIEDPK